MPNKKVFVSGCYDLLHSGHVEFFMQASGYGDLYVGIGPDETYLEYKHRKPMFPQEERLFMVKSVRYVKDAYINAGRGVIDFLPTLDIVRPDIFVVNAEGGSDEKRRICRERGIQYIELQRTPHEGLQARSSSSLKAALGAASESRDEGIPTRIDIAGTWIDQPYVSVYHPGWAITISVEPTFEVRDRCGLSTSTRNAIKKIWPVKLPKMDPEMLARLVFCFENNPEREAGHISGAQDAIGICVPGLARHYYDNGFWPKKIENTTDEMTLRFLEDHLVVDDDAFVRGVEQVAEHRHCAASFFVCKYWQTCSFLYFGYAVVPGFDKECELIVEFCSPLAFGYCANDDSKVAWFDALYELLEARALLFRFDLAAYVDFVCVGDEDEEASCEGDFSCEPRTLGVDGLLGYLHHDGLAYFEHVLYATRFLHLLFDCSLVHGRKFSFVADYLLSEFFEREKLLAKILIV